MILDFYRQQEKDNRMAYPTTKRHIFCATILSNLLECDVIQSTPKLCKPQSPWHHLHMNHDDASNYYRASFDSISTPHLRCLGVLCRKRQNLKFESACWWFQRISSVVFLGRSVIRVGAWECCVGAGRTWNSRGPARSCKTCSRRGIGEEL